MPKKKGMECVCGEIAKESHTNIEGYKVRSWKCKKCGEEYIDSSDAEFVLLASKTRKNPIKARVGVLGESYIIRIPKEIAEIMHIAKGKVAKITLAGPNDILITVES
ncbi:MAG: AbrB/MazE/SpoVT family DNA-binding domain-containing protein [Thermoplasmata archaeon]|nr:MAG: AbrB/MazE/SpoVT family DNA-binding domain-containing protein [Thermoplasmata archaeon]